MVATYATGVMDAPVARWRCQDRITLPMDEWVDGEGQVVSGVQGTTHVRAHSSGLFDTGLKCRCGSMGSYLVLLVTTAAKGAMMVGGIPEGPLES